jgi:diguanylate cyclase (GGDEF)-like protein
MEKPFAMIIEDDRDIVALFRHVLDMNGYHTEAIFHGDIASERLKTSHPDLIVLDLKLPGISGAELLDQISVNEDLLPTAIVVVTAFSEIAESLTIKPDLILYKPVDLNQFITLIQRIHTSHPVAAQIESLATPWDEITGLYNRPFFINRLECALRNSKRISGYHFAILLICLDRQEKELNRDQTRPINIRKMAQIVRSCLRTTDTLAYFEVNNITVLIEDISSEKLTQMIANRIRETIAEAMPKMANDSLKTMNCVGTLIGNENYTNTEEILKDAEEVLLKVKSGEESVDNVFTRELLIAERNKSQSIQ